MIYFIRVGAVGPVKIGYAQNPKKRLVALQTSHHDSLTLLAVVNGGYKEEKTLHERFQQHRLQGEWFSPHPELLDYISQKGQSPDTIVPEDVLIRLPKSKTPWKKKPRIDHKARAENQQLRAMLRKQRRKRLPYMEVFGLEYK